MDVALITCSDRPHLSHSDTLLQSALAARDIEAGPLVWNDAAVDWSSPLVGVIRSTWDYHLQRPAFLRWAQHVSQVQTLWNPLPILHWNTHKSYLYDLEKWGVPIIPTRWVVQGASVDLAKLMQDHGWSEVVIKPAVSADAYGTILIEEGMAIEGQLYLDHMLSTHDMLIQPFFPAIMSRGERSLIYIDGEITHAVVRPPVLSRKPVPEPPKKALIALQDEDQQLARKVIAALPSPVLYARIDLVDDMDGKACVMEIELVEPELWLTWMPAAAERFADAIAREVQQARSRRAE
jgi:glutathione synthase/RimK-type ligase-like ATP-grasp enzyme